jgi:hypothetical protein
MKHPIFSTASALAALSAVLVPASSAQRVVPPEEAQGLFSNWASGIGVRGASDPVMIRAPAIAGGAPVAWDPTAFGAANPGHPDYSTSALTDHWKPFGATTPDFGGISTGGDQTPDVDPTGHLPAAFGGWYALAVSAGPGAVGIPNSMVALRAGTVGDLSGDILSYYPPGITGINSRFLDTVRLESSREQLQLSSVTSTPRVVNLDYGIGVISADQQANAGATFPVRNRFYFSLTRAWVDHALQCDPQFTLDNDVPNAANIYVMTWQPGTGWSEPLIAFGAVELFPSSQFTNINRALVEIDALTVDETTSSPCVISSLTPDSDNAGGGTFDQILVFQRTPACPTTALSVHPSVSGPQHVSERLGFQARIAGGEPDDVTATCLLEPDAHLLTSVLGFATDQPRTGKGDLGLAAFRTCPNHDEEIAQGVECTDVLQLQVTGLDNGYPVGLIQLYEEGPVGTGDLPTPWGEPFWIDTNVEKLNAFDVAIPVPHDLEGQLLRVSAGYYGIASASPLTVVPLGESWVISIEY